MLYRIYIYQYVIYRICINGISYTYQYFKVHVQLAAITEQLHHITHAVSN